MSIENIGGTMSDYYDQLHEQVTKDKMSFDEFQKLDAEFSQANKREKINILLYWDDIIQSTTYGLLIHTLTSNGQKVEKKHIEGFVDRGRDFKNSRPWDYVATKTDMTSIYLKDLYIRDYDQILMKSPFLDSGSAVYNLLVSKVVDTVTVYFSVDHENLDFSNESIKEMFVGTDNEKFDLSVKFNCKYLMKQDDEVDLHHGRKDLHGNYDYIFTSHADDVLEYIFKNKVMNRTIVTPEYHNGLGPAIYAAYLDSDEGYVGPYNTQLIFYKEDTHGQNNSQTDGN